jgi:hypothetical protein
VGRLRHRHRPPRPRRRHLPLPGGYEPDLRHRSNDADVQLELVRTTGAVALMPATTLPAADPALAIRDIAKAAITRRLMIITRDSPTAPALSTFLTAVRDQARQLHQKSATHSHQDD